MIEGQLLPFNPFSKKVQQVGIIEERNDTLVFQQKNERKECIVLIFPNIESSSIQSFVAIRQSSVYLCYTRVLSLLFSFFIDHFIFFIHHFILHKYLYSTLLCLVYGVPSGTPEYSLDRLRPNFSFIAPSPPADFLLRPTPTLLHPQLLLRSSCFPPQSHPTGLGGIECAYSLIYYPLILNFLYLLLHLATTSGASSQNRARAHKSTSVQRNPTSQHYHIISPTKQYSSVNLYNILRRHTISSPT